MEGKGQPVELEGGVLESNSEPKNDRKFIGVSFLYVIASMGMVCVAPFQPDWLCIKPTTYKIESQFFSAKLIEDHPNFS